MPFLNFAREKHIQSESGFFASEFINGDFAVDL
jgi:hypothetical protein